MAAHFVVGLVESTFDARNVDGGPDTGFCHVMFTPVHRIANADTGAFPSATYAGKQPVGVFMKCPKRPEPGEKLGGNGHFTAFAALAIDDADDKALSVDVFGSNPKSFAEPKPTLIE